MSTVYVLEPPTKGKVILTTSKGPLDIELWPKEAPKAVRNFVQLCLEGYYDNTIFHRVIKSFLIQGGDPTGTGEGGESIYGSGFPDEFHSRIRFKHRGLVACANKPDTPNSNGSQFFITLDRCDWLDKKHTIFGKITGDSIYNLLTLSEVECDKNDRPLDPLPKILSAEVLWNPFDDIVPRVISTKSSLPSEKKEPKQKAIKKLNLLSFGEEAEEEEKELAAANPRIKSSHDVLNDPRLLKDGLEKDLISPEDIQWEGDDPEISHHGGYGGPGHGPNRPLGRDSAPGAGRGRGMVKGQSRKDFQPSQNGIGKKGPDDIQLLHTDTLIKEVERVFSANHPDPVEIEKAKKILKEHEQSLTEAIARLGDLTDGESDEGGRFLHAQAMDRE